MPTSFSKPSTFDENMAVLSRDVVDVMTTPLIKMDPSCIILQRKPIILADEEKARMNKSDLTEETLTATMAVACTTHLPLMYLSPLHLI